MTLITHNDTTTPMPKMPPMTTKNNNKNKKKEKEERDPGKDVREGKSTN